MVIERGNGMLNDSVLLKLIIYFLVCICKVQMHLKAIKEMPVSAARV